jgi:hypothetical protein
MAKDFSLHLEVDKPCLNRLGTHRPIYGDCR